MRSVWFSLFADSGPGRSPGSPDVAKAQAGCPRAAAVDVGEAAEAADGNVVEP